MATNTPNFSLPKPDANDNFNRAAYNALIDAIDTKVGAKTSAADTHMADLIKHITAGERTKWDAAQLFAFTTSTGASKSTTSGDLNLTISAGFYNVLASDLNGQGTAGHMIVLNRGSSVNAFQTLYTLNQRLYTRYTSNSGTTWSTWLEQETTTGAQAKVDAHAADAVKHITAPERDKWNGGQLWKLSQDNGRAIEAPANTDFNKFNTTGFHRFNPVVGHTGSPNDTLYWNVTIVKHDSDNAVQHWNNTGGDLMYYRRVNSTSTGAFKRVNDFSTLGNVLFGNKLVDQSNANFVGKVSGSTTANPHIAKRKSGTASSTLLAPTGFDVEFSDGVGSVGYGSIQSLDNTLSNPTYPNAGGIAQVLFSFNLIEHVQRTYGTIPGATTADKIAWLKSNLSKLTFNWWGFGSSPAGNKANLAQWYAGNGTPSWGNIASHTNGSVAKLIQILGTIHIDSNGFVHLLAYADASDGTTASVINTDYVELNVELSTDIKSGLANATQSSAGLQSGADKTKLDGISTGANKTTNPAINGSIAIDGVPTVVYAHPTGDGNSHVPATGTTNNGKVLKAGGMANALSWAFVDWSEIINKPSTYLPSAHNHAIADVTGLSTALSNKLDTSQRGAVNGVASLGADGKVPTSQLPTIANTAADITIADSGNYFDGANVETGMQEIGRVLAGSRASLVASAQQLGVI